MADKTIGDLTQAASIGGEDLFVLEQNSEAKKLKGAQLVQYAQDAVGAQVTAATQAAENAAAAKTGAESAQTQAQAARDAILNMIVEAITLESGSPATVEKSLVDAVYKLTFGLPRGEKGATGATGPQGPQGDQGNSGVYVGSGDMPEGYNVQIDPTGEAIEYIPAPATAEVGQTIVVKAVDENGKPTEWEAADAPSRMSIIKTAMDDIAVAGAQYYLGEQTEVSVVLPDDALPGQMINVCWYNGTTAATLSITGKMLAFDYTPSANTRSEINALWDGAYWAVIGNEMEVVNDEA